MGPGSGGSPGRRADGNGPASPDRTPSNRRLGRGRLFPRRGISTPGADDYGTKPDEIYPNTKAAYARAVQPILSGGQTEPPAAVRLAELRRLRKPSQAEVAGRAGIKQAAPARIEGRGDILLSTLRRVVSAMGGRLSIRVEFPDGTAREQTGLVSPLSVGPTEELSAR